MQPRSEQTRTEIIQAALTCFAESGYEHASVAQICQQAGVSKGAFYHHFPGKQALFLVLMESWLGQIDLQLKASRDPQRSVPQNLLEMGGAAQGVFDAAGGQLPMFFEFLSQARLDDQVWQTMISPFRHYQQFFSGMIAEGIGDGSLRPVDPDRAARVIVSFAVGILLQSVIDPQGDDWGAVAISGLEYYLNGITGGAQ